jgi:hypothetical protein
MSNATQLADFLADVIDQEILESKKSTFPEFTVYYDLRKLMERSEAMSISFDLQEGAARDLIHSFHLKLRACYSLHDENVVCLGLPILVWHELITSYKDAACNLLDATFNDHLFACKAKFESTQGIL